MDFSIHRHLVGLLGWGISPTQDSFFYFVKYIRYGKKVSDESNTRQIKVKLSLCLTKHHNMKAYWGVEVSPTRTLTAALDGGEWSVRSIC
jgi:hypothetical protein